MDARRFNITALAKETGYSKHTIRELKSKGFLAPALCKKRVCYYTIEALERAERLYNETNLGIINNSPEKLDAKFWDDFLKSI